MLTLVKSLVQSELSKAICKKMIHCCLTEGQEHTNSSTLQTPHMLN